jgi:RecG-like helicase
MPVTYLKGVGPARAEMLRKLGIITARDLLYHIPHRYEDATTVQPIASLEPGMDVTVVGRVISKGIIPTRKGLRIFQAVVQDESGIIEASWPGQPFLDRSIAKDDTLLLSGTVRFFHGRQLQPREFVNLGGESTKFGEGRVLSVYSATEGLSFKAIRGIIENHLDKLLPLVREYLPSNLLRKSHLVQLPDALRMLHRPAAISEAIKGRDRLAFEELLFVHLLQRRANVIARERRKGITFTNRRELTTALREALPYSLTASQTHAIREIVVDMCSDRKMHRLLQGDVGSGKTIVALFASLLAMENGYQAAIMAPDRASGRAALPNHFDARGAARNCSSSGNGQPEHSRPSGCSRANEERSSAARYRHSCARAGKHGIRQTGVRDDRRAAPLWRGASCETLRQRRVSGRFAHECDTNTAVLALTLYGDLDVSTLTERPAGRQPVTTVIRAEKGRDRVLDFVRRETDSGRQAYIVYPVIEESEKTDLKAATTMFQILSDGVFAGKRVALLHGRLPAVERDQTMRAFRDGQIDVLIATTVIEVGIDVANATVMLVEHPERFGLSQLHQLRGRVGRGAEARTASCWATSVRMQRSVLESLPEPKTGSRSRALTCEFAEWATFLARSRAGKPRSALRIPFATSA